MRPAIPAEDSIIIVDFDKNKHIILRKIKTTKMKVVAVVNILCLNNQFLRIKELINNPEFFKLFYGGTRENFNNMINCFGFKNETDAAWVYVGANLKIDEDVIRRYWNWRLSFKKFSPLLSSKGEEI